MIYYFQWKNGEDFIIKRLRDRQGYAGFKLLDVKKGQIDGEDILQVKVEWNGDPTERPHPLWKEMTAAGGEVYRSHMER